MNLIELNGILQQFKYYKMLGEKSMSQISEEQLFLSLNEESNSIAIIVKHLWGNMMSRWTDFLNSDGEKEWRMRDQEFENDINNRAELDIRWNEAWDCLFSALTSLKEEDFGKTIYIRNQGHSISEAIYRQLAHYPYHIGQIVFLAKMYSNKNWESLSIPRGQSDQFNTKKFAEERTKKHFTEDFLKNEKKED